MVLFSLIVFACSLALGLHFSYRGLSKSAQGLALAAACLIGVGTIASGEAIIGAVLIGCGVIFVIGSVIRPAKIIDRKARPEYRFCPNCSSKLETRDFEGKPKLACPSCSFVYWNNPIVVGVALIPSEDGDSIVLTKRGLNPKKGFWCLPGGFGEPNEHPKETAARESEEEASLDIEIDRLLAVHAAPGANQVLIFYLAKPTAKIPVRGSDAEEARFFKLDALPEDIAFSTHLDVINEFKKAWLARKSA